MVSFPATRIVLALAHAGAAGLIYALVPLLIFANRERSNELSFVVVAVAIALCAVLPAVIILFWWLHRHRYINGTTGAIIGFEAALVSTLIVAAPLIYVWTSKPVGGDALTVKVVLSMLVIGHLLFVIFIAVPIGSVAAALIGRRMDRLGRIEAALSPVLAVKPFIVTSGRRLASAGWGWGTTSISPLKLYLAWAHAGAAASLYLVFRQSATQMRWDEVDPYLCAAMSVAILFFWWLHRRREMHVGLGALIGLEAAILGTTVVMSPMFAMWISKPGSSAPAFWEVLALTLVVLSRMVMVGLVTIPVGAATGMLLSFLSRRPHRYAIAAVIALAVLATLVPAKQGLASLGLRKGLIYALVGDNTQSTSFPVRLTIDLTVYGTPVTIEHVVACERPARGVRYREPPLHNLRASSLKSFGHVFSDGSGVFVIAPSICVRMRTSVDPNWLQIGWTPAATALETFDLYANGAADERHGAAVQLRRVTVEPAMPGTLASPPDFFAKFGERLHGGKPEGGEVFHAAIGTAIARSVWSKDPDLMALFEPLVGTTYLPNTLRLDQLYHPGPASPISPSAPGRIFMRPLGYTFPLRRDGDGWRAALTERGVMTFYRSPEPLVPSPLQIDGRAVDGAISRYVYDSASASLIVLSSHRMGGRMSDMLSPVR